MVWDPGGPQEDVFANVILMEYTITPPRIAEYSHIVKFDIGRRMHSKSWLTQPGFPSRPNGTTPVPVRLDQVNDDAWTNVKTDEPSATNKMYAFDAPSSGFTANFLARAPIGTRYYFHGNAEEFVRVGISDDPHGNGLKGSRASAKSKWHFRHHIEVTTDLGVKLLFRTTGDDMETDENDIGDLHITMPEGPPQ